MGTSEEEGAAINSRSRRGSFRNLAALGPTIDSADDGVCHRHGADAAQRLRDEPALQRRLAEAGLTEADYPAIEAAVTAHSAPKEVSREHPHWPLIALLKDADGLDRVRLGDLDPRYPRHPEARGMVPFAQALFDATDGVIPTGLAHFPELLAVANGLAADKDGRRLDTD